MIKTIRVTSLIGLILKGFYRCCSPFSQRQFPVCLNLRFKTTVNGETTMQSAETSSLIYNWILCTYGCKYHFIYYWYYSFKIMTKKTTMSAVLLYYWWICES